MNYKSLILTALALSCAITVSAWGKLGHATIAEIAERHLTPKAKANIDKYTGGQPLATFASWMDIVRNDEPFKQELDGYHASICTADCKSPIYVRKFHRNCRDAVSGIEFYAECLKDFKEMPDSMVFVYIKAMVHMVGDFHCPAHVRYTDEVNQLKYNVIFFGDEVRFHNVWDSGVLNRGSGLKYPQYSEYADRLDTWNKRQIKKATEGWAQEWFEDAARDIRPIIRTVPKMSELGQEFVDKHIELGELQIRKGGYQLAKLLNSIFGE